MLDDHLEAPGRADSGMIINALREIAEAISHTVDLPQLFAEIHKSVSRVIDTRTFAIALYEEKERCLRFAYGMQEDSPCKTIDLGDGSHSLTARVALSRQPLLITREEILAEQKKTGKGVVLGREPEVWLGVPLMVYQSLIGVVVVQNYEDPSAYGPEDVATLMAVGSQVALAIERKQLESSLRAANARFRVAMDSLEAMVYVADLETHEILFLNSKVREHLGAREGDICWQVLQEGQEGPCPFCTNHLLVDAEGVPRAPYVWESYNSKTRQWTQCIDKAITWLDGRLVRLEVAIDISDKKKMEESLAASELRFRTFFGAINDAVFVHPFQREGFATFVEVNQEACRRYNYSREEFLAMSAADLNAPEFTHEHGAMRVRQQLLDKGQLVMEAVHTRKNGESFPVEINANLFSQEGKPHILAVVRDITERKEAERQRLSLESQLLQSQKMESIGRLAGGVAHDFNNMLGVILGHTEMLMEESGAPWHVRDSLSEIHKAAARSADLTRQLLTFARKQVTSPKVIDLGDRVVQMATMLKRLIGEGIELQVETQPNLWLTSIDPVQIDQVLANLCVNARDAIASHGRISISLSNCQLETAMGQGLQLVPAGRYIRIRVEDSGCGMSEETTELLFEPFYTTKEVGKGTGLGLSTVYGIVKQNQGAIQVESKLGEGSTFVIYLQAELGEQPEYRVVSRGQPKFAGLTVLVVEDETALLEVTRQMLLRLGWRVLSAQTPSQAQRIIERSRETIHLLLTDIIMPEMDGRRLASWVKKRRPEIICLFMSGYADDILGENSVLPESSAFLLKPFSKAELAAKLDGLLGIDSTRQALEACGETRGTA